MSVVATHFLHSQPTMPITLPSACQQRLLGQPDDSSGISGAWVLFGGWEDAEKIAGVGRTHSGVTPRFNLGAAEVQVMCGSKTLWETPFSYLPLLPKEGFLSCLLSG